MRTRPRPDYLILTVIFLTLSVSSAIWVRGNQTPPAWDPADHISAGYDYYAPLARLDFREFAREFAVYPHYYAPLAHLVTAAIFLLFGATRLTAVFVNFLSLALLLGSVSWLYRRLFIGKTGAAPETLRLTASQLGGVLAALLATCYHFPAWLLHDAFLDYPLMAIVTVTFALLIRADDFQKTRDALWFGVAAGCGLLTKQTFAFFFLLPALYVTARVLASRRWHAIGNLTLAALAALAVAALWYAPHLQDVIEIYRANQAGAINENEAPLFSLMSNLFYIHGLLSPQMQMPLALLFLFGLLYSLRHYRRESLMLYLWLASGIGAFSLIANKDLRYTVPVLPAAALLSVCWVSNLDISSARRRVKALKLAPVAAIACWALVSFYNAQFPQLFAAVGDWHWDTPKFRWMIFERHYFGFDHRPQAEDWAAPQLVRAIVTDWGERDNAQSSTEQASATQTAGTSTETQTPEEITPDAKKASGAANAPTVGVVVNLPHLNPSSLALYARLMTEGRGAPALLQVDWITAAGTEDRLLTCDYLVARTGLDQAAWLAPVERPAERLLQSGQFQLLASFPLPLENAEAVVYKRLR